VLVPQMMNKRMRGEEAGQPPLDLCSRRPTSQFQSPSDPIYHAITPIYSLHFLPIHMHRTPFSWPYLELYNDICQCEEQLNQASSPLEIQDVLDECFMFMHRMSDQGDRELFERVVDLEFNIQAKLTRSCRALLGDALTMTNNIQERYQHYPSAKVSWPSQDQAEALMKMIDGCHHCFPPPLKAFYVEVRAQLVSYILEESDSSDEDGLHLGAETPDAISSVSLITSSSNRAPPGSDRNDQ